MTAWRDLGMQLDEAVNAQWSERLRVLPQMSNQSGPDFTRPVTDIVGIASFALDQILSAAGETARGSNFITRMAEAELTFSISNGQLPFALQAHDLLHALDRDRLYFEVDHISGSFDDRQVVAVLMVARDTQ